MTAVIIVAAAVAIAVGVLLVLSKLHKRTRRTPDLPAARHNELRETAAAVRQSRQEQLRRDEQERRDVQVAPTNAGALGALRRSGDDSDL